MSKPLHASINQIPHETWCGGLMKKTLTIRLSKMKLLAEIPIRIISREGPPL
jgi:hypothetical protein